MNVQFGDDLGMMKAPNEWPLGIVLPLKQRTPPHNLGYLIDGHGPKVYHGNVITISHKDKFTQYASYDEVALDWMVD